MWFECGGIHSNTTNAICMCVKSLTMGTHVQLLISITSLICFLWCGMEKSCGKSTCLQCLSIGSFNIYQLVAQIKVLQLHIRRFSVKIITIWFRFTDISARRSKANYCLWRWRWSSGRHLSGIAKWPFCLTLLATLPATLWATLGGTLPHWHW